MQRTGPRALQGSNFITHWLSRGRPRHTVVSGNEVSRWLVGVLTATVVGALGIVFEWWAPSMVLAVLLAAIGAALVMRTRQLIGSAQVPVVPAVQFGRPYGAGAEEVRLGLAELAKKDDSDTHEHSRWVADAAVMLGRELGLSDSVLGNLYWAGILHDLGKLAVSKAILGKTGRLTEEELREIQRHPTVGADIVAAVLPHESDLIGAIRHHHERWDGCGYPAGLRGTEIPVSARILSIVDVFEALTSDRAYRAALSSDQAVVYIRGASGLHFDSDLVHSFERLYTTGRIHRSTMAATATLHHRPR